MAMYVMLSTLTEAGRRVVQQQPERIIEVNREVEAMGAHVVEQWATLGPYDFVNIVEAPDNETVMRVSTALAARGTVQFLTMPAIPVRGFISGLKGG